MVAASGFAFWHLRRVFHFGNDDLLQFTLAREEGLSWDLLGANVWGHFAPVNRFAHFAYLEWGGADLTVGAVVATGLVTGLLGTVLWTAYELGLPPLRRVLVVALTGFSIAVVDTAVWLDAALHILPALSATYAVLAAHLRALRRRSAGWHAASVLLFAVGLLTQVRAAFALPLILLADLLLVTAGTPWRDRLRGLRPAAVPLTVMAVIAVVSGVLIKIYYPWGDGSGPPVDAVGQTIAAAFTSMLFPALVGVVPGSLPPVPVQVLAAVLLAGCALALVRRRRADAGPLLFVVLSFLLYYAFLLFSPILFADNVEWTALRLHNVVYVVAPTLLGLAHLRLSRAESPRPRRWTAPAAAGVVAAVAVAGAAQADSRWEWAREAHAYLETVGAGRGEWSAADVTVLPLRAPESVANGWAEYLGRHEALLPLFEPGWSPAPPGGRPVVLDDRGRVRSVVLREEARGALPAGGPAGPGCVATAPGSDALTFPLDERVEGPALFAVVRYELEGRAVRATPATGRRGDEWTPTPWPVTLTPGTGTAVLPLEGEPVRAVALWDLTHGASLCVTDVRVVRPLYRVGGECVDMDEHGGPRARTFCRGAGGDA